MNLITSREQAYQALFNYLQTLPNFKSFTRKLKHWQTVSAEDQPALYLKHSGEVTTPVRGQPARIVLEVELWIYVNTEVQDLTGATSGVGPLLNPLLDAIEKALTPKNEGDHTLTLGGLVHHCWIEGQTQIFEGDLGEEAVAIIPVKLLVT